MLRGSLWTFPGKDVEMKHIYSGAVLRKQGELYVFVCEI